MEKYSAGEQTTPSQLNISLTADGKINLNGVFVDDTQVSKKATEEFAKNPEVQAIISADKDVAHGRVVSVLDIVKSVGVKNFAISIEKK